MCAENGELAFTVDDDIAVSTQYVTDLGTPDIKISSRDKLVYVEVKDYSPVKATQLKHYREVLESSNRGTQKLILLTRYAVNYEDHKGIPDRQVCWFEVYNWLKSLEPQHAVSAYLINSFNSFLEDKRMSIEKVAWEYINGVPAFNNLINMIEAAIKGVGIPFHKNYPGKVASPSYPIKEAFASIWFMLQLEDVHFFSLDKDRQLEDITKFISTAYGEAKQMRINPSA